MATSDIVSRKRADRLGSIRKEWLLDNDTINTHQAHPIQAFNAPYDPRLVPSILSEREADLSNPIHDATTLLAKIQDQSTTCEELTLAVCKRAAVAHQLTNCLTEITFESALERARDLDRIPLTARKPLHGLPITVKDSFHVRGLDTSVGIAALCYDPAPSDGAIPRILQENGAVVIAKTTVPQTMLTADTDSVVFGRTCNAYSGVMGAGGSSGGEGVVVAMGGSALGIGTDGAGSVRMPAFVNGIVGVRPSGYRFPLDGRRILGKGVMGTTFVGPVTVAGPLTRSVRDAQLVFRIVSQARPWTMDPFLLPSPWLGLECPRLLRVGVWMDFDHLHAHPPVMRGFQLAQNRLKVAGHTLVPFLGPSLDNVWQLQKEWVEVQDLRNLRELLKMEEMTNIVRRTGIIEPPERHPDLSLDRLHDLNSRTAQLVLKMASAWNASDIDCLLWIPAPHTAVPFDEYLELSFTGLFNIIDWPAIVLPTGDKADSRLDSKMVKPAAFFGKEDERIQSLYFGHETEYDGLPLSVQLIGRRGEDEMLLAMASIIHDAIKVLQ